jgi:hypothetical protein
MDMVELEDFFPNIDSMWTYTANAFDGEGTFGLYKNKQKHHYILGYTYMSWMRLVNTHKGWLEFISTIIGGKINDCTRKNSRWKDKYVLVVNSTDQRRVLPEIIPYLIIKREQAELLLEALGILAKRAAWSGDYPKRMHDIYARIKELNRVGRV